MMFMNVYEDLKGSSEYMDVSDCHTSRPNDDKTNKKNVGGRGTEESLQVS